MPAVIAGFYGKLPARGDFVRGGLPRDFTDRWDAWLAPAIAGSRTRMGEDWLPAFLEAPVWRFILSAGLCGERAALGVMLPSVDRAGRYFPLTFAALFDAGTTPASDVTWLDRCEAAGRAALEHDAGPDQLGAMLGVPAAQSETETGTMQSIWWTDGAPRVPATRFVLSGMPDPCVYATMLGAEADGNARAARLPQEPITDQPPTADNIAVPDAPSGGDAWESAS